MKKIIIIGSRRRDEPEDYKLVYNQFKKYYNEGDIIVSGGCPKGADKFAEVIAGRMGMTKENGQLIIHLPKKPPKGSPRFKWAQCMYERNTVVAHETEEDSVVIACVARDRTGGTEDTIKKIKRWNQIDFNNIILT
jgi:hypothetical protein